MPMNDAAASGHVCPGIRIHIIDIVQPPGIGIPRIADMDAHHTIVSAALVAKSDAEMPTKPRWEVRSEVMPASMPAQIRNSTGSRYLPGAVQHLPHPTSSEYPAFRRVHCA